MNDIEMREATRKLLLNEIKPLNALTEQYLQTTPIKLRENKTTRAIPGTGTNSNSNHQPQAD